MFCFWTRITCINCCSNVCNHIVAIGNSNLTSTSIYGIQVGWNRSGGSGEIDLIANRGGGSEGGFRFYDYTNAGALNLLVTILGSGATTFSSSVTATGFFNSSDIRLKELVDITYDPLGITLITYKWKDGSDDKNHVGYSAQQVQEHMPDAVSENKEGFLSVDYIQVLVAKVAALEKRVKELEDK